jgi:hypothetical protein
MTVTEAIGAESISSVTSNAAGGVAGADGWAACVGSESDASRIDMTAAAVRGAAAAAAAGAAARTVGGRVTGGDDGGDSENGAGAGVLSNGMSRGANAPPIIVCFKALGDAAVVIPGAGTAAGLSATAVAAIALTGAGAGLIAATAGLIGAGADLLAGGAAAGLCPTAAGFADADGLRPTAAAGGADGGALTSNAS